MVRPLVLLLLAGSLLAWSIAGTDADSVARAADPPGGVLASTDSNVDGVVAEVTECKRKDGVLTLKVRFRNTGEKEAEVRLISARNYDSWYLTAGSKKYFVLRDAEKTPLAPQPNAGGDLHKDLPPGGSHTWWAKYPAPPADVKAVNVFSPVAPPMDDVPITDP